MFSGIMEARPWHFPVIGLLRFPIDSVYLQGKGTALLKNSTTSSSPWQGERKGAEMTEQEESCDIRIWCEECQLCDYTSVGDKYFCTSCGKLLQLDLKVHQANFNVVTDDKDQPC
jgi:hypothetical protein